MQRALAMCPTGAIEVRHLPAGLQPARSPVGELETETEPVNDGLRWTDSVSFLEARKHAQEKFEIAYFDRLLEHTNHNVSEAARRAGLDRSNLRRILRRLKHISSIRALRDRDD